VKNICNSIFNWLGWNLTYSGDEEVENFLSYNSIAKGRKMNEPYHIYFGYQHIDAFDWSGTKRLSLIQRRYRVWFINMEGRDKNSLFWIGFVVHYHKSKDWNNLGSREFSRFQFGIVEVPQLVLVSSVLVTAWYYMQVVRPFKVVWLWWCALQLRTVTR
jgi:hypothetical protein